ncbi:MAG: family 16 glycoside hydrolase [Verrucomicrobiota bacterium]
MRFHLYLVVWCCAVSAMAAERLLDFNDFTADATPTNFTSLVVGRGKPAEWRVILDEVPSALVPLTSKATSTSSRAVLSQKTREPFSNRLPLLLYDNELFRDFKFVTRFKLVGGALEQSAGIVFHFQNASNFYVVQASAVSGTFRCTKMVDGIMKPPIGPEVKLAKGEWHEMAVRCEGPRITCALDGTELVKLVDNASANITGKVGFCTQADAVSYFTDGRITFTAQEAFAEKIVRDTLKEYSRLVALKIFAIRDGAKDPVIIGSGDVKELGRPGTEVEADVIRTGHSYFGKGKQTVTVVLPLRDHNGDVMAAVSVEMKKFIGQTEDNALVRAQPIVKKIQTQVQSLDDLLQ